MAPVRLIVVGGLGCSPAYMLHFAEAVFRLCPDVAVGYHPLVHGLGPEEEAELICEFYAGAQERTLAVVGFSTGCAVALALARRTDWAGRIRDLVLVAPAHIALSVDPVTTAWMRACAGAPAPAAGTDEGARLVTWRKFGVWGSWVRWARIFVLYWLGTLLHAVRSVVPPRWVRGLLRALFRKRGAKTGGGPEEDREPGGDAMVTLTLPPRAVRETVARCILSADLTARVRDVRRPVHVVVGTRDPHGAYSRFLHEQFGHTHVRLHQIHGGGHHLLFHQPQAAARRVTSILRL